MSRNILLFCLFSAVGANQFVTDLKQCDSTFNAAFGNFSLACHNSRQSISIHWHLRERIAGFVINATLSLRRRGGDGYAISMPIQVSYCELMSGRTYSGFVTVIYNMVKLLPTRQIIEKCPIEPDHYYVEYLPMVHPILLQMMKQSDYIFQVEFNAPSGANIATFDIYGQIRKPGRPKRKKN